MAPTSTPPAPGAPERLIRAVVQVLAGGSEVRGPAWAGWPAQTRGRIIAVVAWIVVVAGTFTLSLVSLRSLHHLLGPLASTPRTGDAVFASLLLSVPLLALRRSPLLTTRLMAVGLAWIVFCSDGRPPWPWPPSALVAYAVVFVLAARTMPPSRLPGLWVWTMAALWISGRGANAGVLVTMGAIAGVLGGLGAALRDRTVAREELAATSAERDAESARSAVLAERTRIARELHDVVAHHMAMISIQAQAAQLRIPELPPAAAQTFDLIEHAARQALSETRGIVGLLRGEERPVGAAKDPAPGRGPPTVRAGESGAHSAPAPPLSAGHHAAASDSPTDPLPGLARESAAERPPAVAGIPPAERLPAPTLDNLADLVEAARVGGLTVELSMTGTTRGVPASTALTAYRMVQEGLANAAAHAPGAAVRVEVARAGQDLHVSVANGPPPGAVT